MCQHISNLSHLLHLMSQLSHLESAWSGSAECSPGGRWQQTSAGTKTSQEPLASWTLLVLITLREIITRFVQSPELINYQFIINFDQIRYLCNEYLCLTELSFFYMLIISFSSLSSCEKGTNRVLLSKGSKLWRDFYHLLGSNRFFCFGSKPGIELLQAGIIALQILFHMERFQIRCTDMIFCSGEQFDM